MNTPFAPETLDHWIARPRICALKAAAGIEGDALVLGAAGKMGLHLCLMLKRCFALNGQRNRVLAVSRFSQPSARAAFECCGIDTVPCDLSEDDQLAQLPDTDAAWFMAGVKFGTRDNPDVLQRMNVTMPEKTARRFKAARMVALSTGCVYAFVPADSGGSLESDAVSPQGAYAQSCWGRESAFRRVANEDGLRAVLIRLNYAVEMRYGVLVDIAEKVRSQTPINLAMGWFNCIWQGDALAHIVGAIDCAAVPADTLNVTGPETLSIRDTAQRFGAHFGIEPIFKGDEQANSWLSCADRAMGLFGQPEVTPDDMINWITAWLEAGGNTLGKPTKFEVRDGNF